MAMEVVLLRMKSAGSEILACTLPPSLCVRSGVEGLLGVDWTEWRE